MVLNKFPHLILLWSLTIHFLQAEEDQNEKLIRELLEGEFNSSEGEKEDSLKDHSTSQQPEENGSSTTQSSTFKTNEPQESYSSSPEPFQFTTNQTTDKSEPFQSVLTTTAEGLESSSSEPCLTNQPRTTTEGNDLLKSTLFVYTTNEPKENNSSSSKPSDSETLEPKSTTSTFEENSLSTSELPFSEPTAETSSFRTKSSNFESPRIDHPPSEENGSSKPTPFDSTTTQLEENGSSSRKPLDFEPALLKPEPTGSTPEEKPSGSEPFPTSKPYLTSEYDSSFSPKSFTSETNQSEETSTEPSAFQTNDPTENGSLSVEPHNSEIIEPANEPDSTTSTLVENGSSKPEVSRYETNNPEENGSSTPEPPDFETKESDANDSAEPEPLPPDESVFEPFEPEPFYQEPTIPLVYILKPGYCPFIPPLDLPYPRYCQTDFECPDDEKCCFAALSTGGSMCMAPFSLPCLP